MTTATCARPIAVALDVLPGGHVALRHTVVRRRRSICCTAFMTAGFLLVLALFGALAHLVRAPPPFGGSGSFSDMDRVSAGAAFVTCDALLSSPICAAAWQPAEAPLLGMDHRWAEDARRRMVRSTAAWHPAVVAIHAAQYRLFTETAVELASRAVHAHAAVCDAQRLGCGSVEAACARLVCPLTRRGACVGPARSCMRLQRWCRRTTDESASGAERVGGVGPPRGGWEPPPAGWEPTVWPPRVRSARPSPSRARSP